MPNSFGAFVPTSWAEELTEDTETPAVEVADASDEDQDPSQNAEESADEGTAAQPEDEAVSQDGSKIETGAQVKVIARDSIIITVEKI